MKNKKVVKALKLYGLIGTALCGGAGGIVGFIIGGPLLALTGALLGSIGGHLIEKSVLKSAS